MSIASSSRIYAAPARTWPLSAAAEAEIEATFQSTAPIEEQLTEAAIALSRGRLQLIADRPMHAQLLADVESYYRKPTQFCGVELVDQDAVTEGLRRFVAATIDITDHELPDPQEYRSLRVMRGGARWEQIKDMSVYMSVHPARESSPSPPSYNHLADMILIPPYLSDTNDAGISLITSKQHELEHRIRFHAGDIYYPHVLTRAYFYGLAFMPFFGAYLFFANHHDETHCIGAEWELLKRIPNHVRQQIHTRIADNFSDLGLDFDDLRHRSTEEQVPILGKAMQREPERIHAIATMMILGIQSMRMLEASTGTKKAYIVDTIRTITGDDKKQFIHTNTIHSLAVTIPWTSDIIKLGLGLAGWWVWG